MKVIVDDKIPYIRNAIQTMADETVFASGQDINADLVRDADALIIRTRTRCDKALLAGSRVRFIATATIGYDHIDTRYCREVGITWANCPGCNAAAVAQYVESVLLIETAKRNIPLHQLTLGIVGVGSVGRLVAEMAASYGMQTLLNDPPRALEEGNKSFVSLAEIAAHSDIISLHVPFVREGKYCTRHLIDSAYLNTLQRHPLLINTSRGEVADSQAILHALEAGWLSDAVLDVWENEPYPNPELLQRVSIGTPHIAGYSADGKANATRMVLEQFRLHFGYPAICPILPPAPDPNRISAATKAEALLQIYDPRKDSEALKAHPERFEWFRGHYPLRREKTAYVFNIG